MIMPLNPYRFGLPLGCRHRPPPFDRRGARGRALRGIDASFGSVTPAHADVVVADALGEREDRGLPKVA